MLSTVVTAYDLASRITSATSRYNNTVGFTYDNIGRKATETLTTHGQTFTTGYSAYDADSRLTELTYASGATVTRAYNNDNTVSGITYDNDGAGGNAAQSIATCSYDRFAEQEQINSNWSSGSCGSLFCCCVSSSTEKDSNFNALQDNQYSLVDLLMLRKSGFTGREHDEDIDNLMYFRSRYFHNTLGRFISHDVDYLDGLNLYAGYFGQWFRLDPLGREVVFANPAIRRGVDEPGIHADPAWHPTSYLVVHWQHPTPPEEVSFTMDKISLSWSIENTSGIDVLTGENEVENIGIVENGSWESAWMLGMPMDSIHYSPSVQDGGYLRRGDSINQTNVEILNRLNFAGINDRVEEIAWGQLSEEEQQVISGYLQRSRMAAGHTKGSLRITVDYRGYGSERPEGVLYSERCGYGARLRQAVEDGRVTEEEVEARSPGALEGSWDVSRTPNRIRNFPRAEVLRFPDADLGCVLWTDTGSQTITWDWSDVTDLGNPVLRPEEVN